MNKKEKMIMILSIIILLFTAFTCAYAGNFPDEDSTEWITIAILKQKEQGSQTESTKEAIKLPSSLTVIEDEAFEGTALTTINLPDTVETIGDSAFANIPTLKNITIPSNTTDIGKNAFKGSNQVAIIAAPKGYARTWAKENGIPFIPITSFYAFNTPVQVTGLTQTRTEQRKFLLDGEATVNKTSQPTGRMNGELNADKYEELTAFHIQGRSPPMC